MNISYNQLLVNKRRVKRRIKKKASTGSRCHHCSGAFRASEEVETCLMCGREKGHACANCQYVPEETLNQEKKLA
jgi:rRNA maturation endonuclease Nob1